MPEPTLPGGWLPPRPPGGPHDDEPSRRAAEPQAPVFVRPDRAVAGERNGLAVAALVCAISSLTLLVLSLGLSFALSLPLAGAAWVCAARARPDVRPGQRRAGLTLAIIAVALSVLAAVVWVALEAAGVSVQDLQDTLQRELERQRRAGG